MDVYKKRSTTSAPDALSISYLIGSPPTGTSTTTFTSRGVSRPIEMASRRIGSPHLPGIITFSGPDTLSDPVYRDRDFRLFLGVRVLSTLAVMIQSVAVGWQVYDMERTPLALAWVGLAEFVPMFLLTLPAGAVVDHTDQRKVLSLAFFIQAASAGLLLGLSLAHVRSAWPFYAVIAVFGVARAFYGPSAQSLLAFLVPPERLPRAIALSSSAYQAAVIAGPALAGFIYALGPPLTYGICLVAYCVAGVAAAAYGGRRNQPQ